MASLDGKNRRGVSQHLLSAERLPGGLRAVVGTWLWRAIEAFVVLYLTASSYLAGLGFVWIGFTAFVAFVFLILIIRLSIKIAFVAPRKRWILELGVLSVVAIIGHSASPRLFVSGRRAGFLHDKAAMEQYIKETRQSEQRFQPLGQLKHVPVPPNLRKSVVDIQAARFGDASFYMEFERNLCGRGTRFYIVYASDGQATDELLEQSAWSSEFPAYKLEVDRNWWSTIGSTNARVRYPAKYVSEFDKG